MQAAFRKRGITDFGRVMVDPWSAGNFGIEEEIGAGSFAPSATTKLRITTMVMRGLYLGLYAIFDLNRLEVMKVVDKGPVPLSRRLVCQRDSPGGYRTTHLESVRGHPGGSY
ncbi:hypothetical protein VK70_07070 [Paenibacillus durus ATCC 35681]|uniref:Uncharacterized protein n=2 Tax=Paenibacillus durus TaxID=44251 RepID=A0A0F7F870_PAEDU|nr:hypothetical protein VK70_07070 [Paenibacillus durus ATCC 35681]